MKTIPIIQRNAKASRTAGLLVLLGCSLLQGQAVACGSVSDGKPTHPGQPTKVVVSQSHKDTSPIDLDYYQSSDNPMRD